MNFKKQKRPSKKERDAYYSKIYGKEPEEKKVYSEKEVEKLLEKKEYLTDDLKLIDDRELVIVEVENDRDDDFWNDFDYYPNPELEGIVESTEETILELIEAEFYEDALELFYSLTETRYFTEGETRSVAYAYYDLQAFDIYTVADYKLGDPLIEFVYERDTGERRASEIVEIIKKLGYSDFRLKELEDKEDFDEFLSAIIDYLGLGEEGSDEDLLAEAIILKDDYDFAVTSLGRFSDHYPGLCLELLENGNFSSEERLKLSEKALGMKVESKMREKLAEHFTRAAEEIGREDLVDRGLFEIFLSHKDPRRYLEALYKASDTRKMKEKLSKVVSSLPATSSEDTDYKNNPILKFLDGDFNSFYEEMLASKINGRVFLDFLKLPLSLFLMLYSRDEEIYSYERVRDAFKEALNFSYPNSSDVKALDAFRKWKEDVVVDLDFRKKVLTELEDLLKRAVGDIVERDERFFYGTSADFVLAFADTEESLGMTGAKERLISYFKENYPQNKHFLKVLD